MILTIIITIIILIIIVTSNINNNKTLHILCLHFLYNCVRFSSLPVQILYKIVVFKLEHTSVNNVFYELGTLNPTPPIIGPRHLLGKQHKMFQT